MVRIYLIALPIHRTAVSIEADGGVVPDALGAQYPGFDCGNKVIVDKIMLDIAAFGECGSGA